eukprot:957123-Amphidinium_carterae.1
MPQPIAATNATIRGVSFSPPDADSLTTQCTAWTYPNQRGLRAPAPLYHKGGFGLNASKGLEGMWRDAWPPVTEPNLPAQLCAAQLQEISRIMRVKAKDCGKPSLTRMSYGAYPDKHGWEHYSMPISAWQADCLFCEFMPPADLEKAWLAG